MFDLGMQELIVIFIVALLVFGPKKLPELARSLGKGVGHLKKAMFDIKYEMDRELEGVNPVDLEGLPDWKAENLKKILEDRTEDADGTAGHEGEEGGPRDKGMSGGAGTVSDPYGESESGNGTDNEGASQGEERVD